MNDKAEFAVKILKEYAEENLIPPRSTSDLSPMEEWLILRLLEMDKMVKRLTEIFSEQNKS